MAAGSVVMTIYLPPALLATICVASLLAGFVLGYAIWRALVRRAGRCDDEGFGDWGDPWRPAP